MSQSLTPPEFQFGGELSRPVRLAYGLVPLFQLLESRNEPTDPLLAAAEIPRFALEEPSYRISLAQELAFTRLALERLDYDIGLAVGARFHLSMFGVLGLAAACCGNLRESFRLLLSYPALVWGIIEITVWRDSANEYIVFAPGVTAKEFGDYFVERDMAALLVLFRNTLGTAVVPSKVQLRREPPLNDPSYDAFFGCSVIFDAAENTMHFGPEIWGAKPPQANSMSRRFFENQCRDLSETMRTPFSYTDIVRSRLRHATPIPSLPDMAAGLHLTARTLQRRLAGEGAQFASLLREIRTARAKELIEYPGISIEDISFRLGFRDPDAFSRAFRHWTGYAPTEFRRQLKP